MRFAAIVVLTPEGAIPTTGEEKIGTPRSIRVESGGKQRQVETQDLAFLDTGAPDGSAYLLEYLRQVSLQCLKKVGQAGIELLPALHGEEFICSAISSRRASPVHSPICCGSPLQSMTRILVALS